MFKKIMSLVLALVMVASVAMVAASAAQVEIAGSNADVPAEVAADAPADTGAANIISFDTQGTGWANFKYISFYIWPYGGECFEAWGSKKSRGTDNGDGTYSFDLGAHGITLEDGVTYCIIFYNENSAQTYDLMLTTACIGDTAYCDGTTYENPADSSKTSLVAKWKGQNENVCGPLKVITSIGNVVGTCIPKGVSAYSMFVGFLKDTLDNARTYSGKDDQTLLDDTAKAVGSLKAGDVKDAIAESGREVAWDESKSTLDKGNDDSAKQESDGNGGTTPSGNNGGGNNGGSGNGGNNNGGSTSTGSGSGSKTTGSAANSKTGQDSTMLYVMLGVMILAAGVIVVVRRKERA